MTKPPRFIREKRIGLEAVYSARIASTAAVVESTITKLTIIRAMRNHSRYLLQLS
jgi:hypothetical protein